MSPEDKAAAERIFYETPFGRELKIMEAIEARGGKIDLVQHARDLRVPTPLNLVADEPEKS